MVGVDISGYLEYESGKLAILWFHHTLQRLRRTRAGRNLHKAVEQLLHTEVVQGRPEEYRGKFTAQILAAVKRLVNPVYQFQVTGFLSPELYLRDSFGRYTWAYRLTEDCIK